MPENSSRYALLYLFAFVTSACGGKQEPDDTAVPPLKARSAADYCLVSACGCKTQGKACSGTPKTCTATPSEVPPPPKYCCAKAGCPEGKPCQWPSGAVDTCPKNPFPASLKKCLRKAPTSLSEAVLLKGRDGRCLEVDGYNLQGGTVVVNRSCKRDGSGQWWVPESVGEGLYRLVNQGGCCLDVPGASGPLSNPKVVHNPCSKSSTQKWRLSTVGKWGSIKTRQDDRCLYYDSRGPARTGLISCDQATYEINTEINMSPHPDRVRAKSPIGRVEGINGAMQLTGLLCDPDAAGPMNVKLVVGATSISVRADQAAGAFGECAGQAYRFTTYPLGAHCGARVEVFGLNKNEGRDARLSGDGLRVPCARPIGRVGLTSPTGAVGGWACDPDEPAKSIELHVYVGAPGKHLLVRRVTANLPSEGPVNAMCGPGSSARHRFHLQLPTAGACGKQVYVYGINVGAGTNAEIPGSRRTIRCNDPVGWLDGVSAAGRVWGWACDRDAPNATSAVQLFVGDRPAPPWKYGFRLNTNAVSEDPINGPHCGGGNRHRFSFILPKWAVRSGRWVHGFAINLGGGRQATPLSGGPKRIP